MLAWSCMLTIDKEHSERCVGPTSDPQKNALLWSFFSIDVPATATSNSFNCWGISQRALVAFCTWLHPLPLFAFASCSSCLAFSALVSLSTSIRVHGHQWQYHCLWVIFLVTGTTQCPVKDLLVLLVEALFEEVWTDTYKSDVVDWVDRFASICDHEMLRTNLLKTFDTTWQC